mmetsp:Transcript_20064/g.80039  ORF Transcript_20064/g.80039 Transcript_20064/m.80039 type:complete len:257 (-) Transcript_20064:1087-1857(-)
MRAAPVAERPDGGGVGETRGRDPLRSAWRMMPRNSSSSTSAFKSAKSGSVRSPSAGPSQSCRTPWSSRTTSRLHATSAPAVGTARTPATSACSEGGAIVESERAQASRKNARPPAHDSAASVDASSAYGTTSTRGSSTTQTHDDAAKSAAHATGPNEFCVVASSSARRRPVYWATAAMASPVCTTRHARRTLAVPARLSTPFTHAAPAAMLLSGIGSSEDTSKRRRTVLEFLLKDSKPRLTFWMRRRALVHARRER